MANDTPPQGGKNEPKELGFLLSLRLAWNLGYIIALPAVIFGLGGAYADKYYHTSPWFLLSGFTVAILLSGIGVYRKVKEILAN
ncbi:MAG: AtpZ/AtpI family protein [Candidatus Peribacteraceae bacterium]|nr:AtpZ/AtpI family protein [Candidatus Peribacteraceae bacterium]MDD5075360.1 AtpZ/AtpI family protein [Candidatus Peribacteraceae bacterium]